MSSHCGHGAQTAAKGVHVVQSYEFANSSDRVAFANEINVRPAPTAADVGRVAIQTDTSEFYVLTNHSPVTWQALGFGGSGTVDHGLLIGLADDDHTQYLTEARHDALPSDNPHGVTAAQVGADPAGAATTAIAAHVALADPHTQYVETVDFNTLLAAYLDRHSAVNTTPAENDTTTFANFINASFTLAHAATYIVTATYYWSHDDGATDFVARLTYDGANVNTQQHTQEPQDTAGAGPFGTNQRHIATLRAIIAGTAASHVFALQWAGSAANDSAAIYEATLTVERWI